jgi:hypothetical protein
MVEGGCGPKRTDTSTPAVIRSPESGRCNIVNSRAGYLLKNRGRFGANTCLENMAFRATRKDPLTALAEPDAVFATSWSPVRCGRANSYRCAPSLVSLDARVVRARG